MTSTIRPFITAKSAANLSTAPKYDVYNQNNRTLDDVLYSIEIKAKKGKRQCKYEFYNIQPSSYTLIPFVDTELRCRGFRTLMVGKNVMQIDW